MKVLGATENLVYHIYDSDSLNFEELYETCTGKELFESLNLMLCFSFCSLSCQRES